MLAERTDYLSAGVHIGMKSCTKYLKGFVYKIRDDGLAVFNLRKVDARIAVVANFISKYENVLVVSRKSNAADAINKFAEVTGAKAIAGRFSPGTLTNPSYRDFFEPDVVISVDPLIDENAIKEAKKKRIPMVALCDTFNEASDVDIIIPANNNGKKSLAMVFMLLAREVLKKRGEIKEDADFKYTIEDFGADAPQADDKRGPQEGAPPKKMAPRAKKEEVAEEPEEKPKKAVKEEAAEKAEEKKKPAAKKAEKKPAEKTAKKEPKAEEKKKPAAKKAEKKGE